MSAKMLGRARLLSHFISNESLIAILSAQKRSFHHLKHLNTKTCLVALNTRQSKIVNTYYLRWNTTASSPSVENLITDESIRETPVNLNAEVASQLPSTVDVTPAITPILPASEIDANLATSSGIDVKQTPFDTPTFENIIPSDSSPLVDQFPNIDEIVAQIGEPSLISQGLGGWAPSGIAQTFFNSIYHTLDVPWWVAIAIGTFVIRVALLPLVVIAQRNAAHFNNYMPQMQVIQLKMTEARKCGNAMMAAKYANEMALFMQEKKLNPFKNMLVPIAQAPIFVSVFLGLRGMANAPIESMKVGGALWFTNLTITDPYYMLPLITTATLYVTIELGSEGGLRTDNNKMMRYILRGLPIILFPFIMNFPSALLCYWVTSNFISLGQVALFRIPSVRKKLKIDALIKHKPETLPMKPKGFVKDFRDTWDNSKVMKKLSEREEFDKLQFRKAGFGPLQKTYPFDPTKQTAKPRDNN